MALAGDIPFGEPMEVLTPWWLALKHFSLGLLPQQHCFLPPFFLQGYCANFSPANVTGFGHVFLAWFNYWFANMKPWEISRDLGLLQTFLAFGIYYLFFEQWSLLYLFLSSVSIIGADRTPVCLFCSVEPLALCREPQLVMAWSLFWIDWIGSRMLFYFGSQSPFDDKLKAKNNKPKKPPLSDRDLFSPKKGLIWGKNV